MENFWGVGYVPQPKQLEFHAGARQADGMNGPDEIGFGGARGPGKSHAILAQLALDDARRVPNFKGLYLRKVGKQAREQFDDLRRSVLRHVPNEFNRNEGVVKLWEDSRIFIGHFQHESDIDNYLGIEYDAIAIEECTALTLTKYRALRDSNRTSKTGWRPRIYNSTNPGNIGHAWYKQKFIAPARANAEKYTRFIFATIDDNVFIDTGYKRKLEENTGWRLRAYRFGDWDIAAGQFFTTWRHEAIVKPAPAHLPHHWIKWAALDYGYTHPTVAYLFAKDDDGNVYVVDEHRQAKWLVQQQAPAIKGMLGRHGVRPDDLVAFVAGHDAFAQKGQSDRTIAEQYVAEGLHLTRANIDRISGAAEVMRMLGDPTNGIAPRLTIFDRCTHLIECLPAMEHDPNRPEDVLKVDVDDDGNGGDDCFVAGTMVTTRYGDIPIELIRPGDMVLTRIGYKPVRDIWISGGGQARSTVEVTFSNGATLVGTPNHRVFTPVNGWMTLDSLRYGVIILPSESNEYFGRSQWQFQRQLSSMGLSFDVIQNLKNVLIRSITVLAEIIAGAASGHCTKRFGNLCTEKFRPAMQSTMLTKIPSIMTSPTWKQSPVQGTHPNTALIQSILIASVNTWTRFDRLLPLGTAPKKGASGTRNMQSIASAIESQLRLFASSAISSLNPYITLFAFAPISARQDGDVLTEWMMLNDTASFAGRHSSVTSLTQRSIAPMRVLGTRDGGNHKTYAIHVDDHHEYYANGVLVSNCYDSARYGILATPGINSYVWN